MARLLRRRTTARASNQTVDQSQGRLRALPRSVETTNRGAIAALPVALETHPMEARLVDELPREPGWQFEPKWDGFRCLAFGAGNEVELRAKSGKSLTRYFPDVVATLRPFAPNRFVLDGELAIPIGNTLSFDALQARLHPAGVACAN